MSSTLHSLDIWCKTCAHIHTVPHFQGCDLCLCPVCTCCAIVTYIVCSYGVYLRMVAQVIDCVAELHGIGVCRYVVSAWSDMPTVCIPCYEYLHVATVSLYHVDSGSTCSRYAVACYIGRSTPCSAMVRVSWRLYWVMCTVDSSVITIPTGRERWCTGMGTSTLDHGSMEWYVHVARRWLQ